VGGAAWSLAGAVAARALGLTATLIAARLLLPRQFGQLSLVQTAVLLLTGVAGAGLRIVAIKRVAETRSADPKAAGEYAGLVLAVTSAASAVIALIYAVFARQVAAALLLDRELAIAVVASAGLVLFVSITGSQTGVLIGLEAFRYLAAFQAVHGLLASTLLVAGILAGGLRGGIVGWMLGEAAAAGVGFWLVTRSCRAQTIRLRFSPANTDWSVLTRVGLPALIAAVLVQSALLGVQRFLAGQPSGLESVAAFSVAYRWQLAVLFIPAAIIPVVLPLIANLRVAGNTERLRKILRTNLVIHLALVMVGSGVVFGLAQGILGLTGGFYTERTDVLYILLLAAIPVAANNVLSEMALGLDAVSAWVWSDVALAVVMVTTALAFVPIFGAVGMALSYFLGYTATCLILVRPVRDHLTTHPCRG
jgi:O-antigen/teichoic acid export membrane protein